VTGGPTAGLVDPGQARAASLPPQSVFVISHANALRALSDDWTRLGARFQTPLLQHDWFLTCAETLHDDASIRVVAVRRGQTIAALAPLALVRDRAATWLEILGSTRLFEPAGLLYEDGAALDALVEGILRLGHPVRLQRIPADSPVVAAVRRRHPTSALVVVRQTNGSCHLPFGRDWQAFVGALGPKCRASFRSKARKATAFGQTSFEEHRLCSEEELAEHLRLAFAIEGSGWKGRNRSALLDNAPLRSFFESYAAKAARAGALRIYFYRIGGEPVAMRIAVEFAGRLWFLKTGYNDSWARLSPGIQLTMDIIKRGIQSGLDGCEFLGSDEPWQHAWPVGTHRYCTVLAYPASLQGVLGTLDTLGTVLRRRFRHRQSSARQSAV
jgi:CelD/BcsL family acetyltransferase involved in cellulose biosynthesis